MALIPPVRVHIAEEHDLYAGRPSKWGNPFSHKPHALSEFKTRTREESINRHKVWLGGNGELKSQLHELTGKKIACWCGVSQKCHVDNLIEAWRTEFCGIF